MASTEGRFSNLQLRVVSAVVLIAAILVPAWFGGMPFRVIAGAIGAIMFLEWVMMTTSGRDVPHAAVSAVALLAALGAVVYGVSPWLTPAVLAAAVALSALSALLFKAGAWFSYGVAYCGLSALALAALRGADTAGFVAVLFLFAVVWVTDIAAYFVGRRIGGPKLAPSISPGKTWSGAVGGALFGTAAGVAVVAAAGLFDTWYYIVLGLGISVVSQAGDLFESAVKRRFGAKDSSRLIPGHGGVLDRVDGLVAAALALYVVGVAVSGLANPAARLFAP